MCRILLTCTDESPSAKVHLANIRSRVESLGNTAFVDDAVTADVIVFWETYQEGECTWAPRLRAHDLVKQHPRKCFVVSQDDRPMGFLPGIYSSIWKKDFDPRYHRAWQYRDVMNPLIYDCQDRADESEPRYECAFAGSGQNPLRKKIFDLYRDNTTFALHETRSGEFNGDKTPEQLRASRTTFIERIRSARFSLCPRGYGPNSYRIQETMALGRVPVIISDDWVPPEIEGASWNEFSIRIAERDVHRLPAILEGHRSRWRDMGVRASEVWKRNFHRDVNCSRILQQIHLLRSRQGFDSSPLLDAWATMIESRRNRKKATFLQRLRKRLAMIRFAT